MMLPLIAQLYSVGLPEPECEFRFCPGRKWKFDLAWPGAIPPLAVEIEGGLYGRGKKCPMCGRKAVGAHSSIQRLLSDLAKYDEAVILGWCVLRVTPEMVSTGEALALIERAFARRRQENEAL